MRGFYKYGRFKEARKEAREWERHAEADRKVSVRQEGMKMKVREEKGEEKLCIR